MKRLTLYKILSYILLPIGALLGFITLMALIYALGNFALLLSVFISGATVAYIFASYVFMQKVVIKKIASKQSLKDLVKVNAYVALVFAILGVVQGVGLLVSKEAAKAFIDTMIAMQPEAIKANKQAFIQTFYGVMYFMIAFSVLLQVHINLTFRYLRENNELFFKS